MQLRNAYIDLTSGLKGQIVKILIVEDHFASRKYMQLILRKYGVCDVAVNGHEAIEAIEQAILENDPYDLACLDIMMPEMDGIDALRRIRECEFKNGLGGNDGVKVIMTTAQCMTKDVMSAFRAGCEAYLTKPIDKDELIAEMQKLGLIQNQLQN